MEDNEIAAKRHKQRKTDCVYGPFASFRGYSLFPWCRLGCGLISNYTGRGHHLSFRPAHRSGWGQPVPIGFAQRGTSRPHPEKSAEYSEPVQWQLLGLWDLRLVRLKAPAAKPRRK